jgi:transposase
MGAIRRNHRRVTLTSLCLLEVPGVSIADANWVRRLDTNPTSGKSPHTTCYNRFVRWRRAGVWGRLMAALAAAHDTAIQMIDTSIVRVHQHAACVTRNRCQSMGRSRGGLTSKIHAVVDTNGLPVRLGLTAGETHDNRLALAPEYGINAAG